MTDEQYYIINALIHVILSTSMLFVGYLFGRSTKERDLRNNSIDKIEQAISKRFR